MKNLGFDVLDSGRVQGSSLGIHLEVDLNQMKRDRINMVAHLVSRVREILSESTS